MAKRLFEFMEEDISIIGEPLRLNIYDLTCMNGYIYWAGLGAYHSAVEAYGTEYAYGAHDYPSSGVFEVKPRQCPGFRFRKSLTIGTIWMDAERFREFIEEMACEYTGDSYHLIYRNCNHFCNDVCTRLVGLPLPNWVNRLAKIGSMCSCFLPKSLQADGPRTLDFKCYDDTEDSSDSSGDAKFSGGSFPFRHLAGNLALVAPKTRKLISSSFLHSTLSDAFLLSLNLKENNICQNQTGKRISEL